MSDILERIGSEDTLAEEIASDGDDYDDDDFDETMADDPVLADAETLVQRAQEKQRASSSPAPAKAERPPSRERRSPPPKSAPRSPTRSSSASAKPAPSHGPPGMTVIRSRKGALLAAKAGKEKVLVRSTLPTASDPKTIRSVVLRATMSTGRRRPATAGHSAKDRWKALSQPKVTPPSLLEQTAESAAWIRRNVKCSCNTAKKRSKCTAETPFPGCARAGKVYAKASDAANCKFRPRLSRKSRQSQSGGGEDCLIRMEAKERARREKLKEEREQAEYDAKVDKKVCGKCGAAQSFAEWSEGMKYCQNCPRSMFRNKIVWGSVQAGFLERMAAQEESRRKKIADAREKLHGQRTFRARPVSARMLRRPPSMR